MEPSLLEAEVIELHHRERPTGKRKFGVSVYAAVEYHR